MCAQSLAAVLSLLAAPLAPLAAAGRGLRQIQGSILCDYGGAQAAGPYAYSNANRCGATSLSTYPYINPYDYPLSQPLAPSEGLFGRGFLGLLRGRKLQQVNVVTSNPTSTSSPVTVISPSTSVSGAGGIGVGGGFNPLRLFGR